VQYLFGALAVVPVAILVTGAVRGRVTMRSCCAVLPEHDGRIAAALREGVPEPQR